MFDYDEDLVGSPEYHHDNKDVIAYSQHLASGKNFGPRSPDSLPEKNDFTKSPYYYAMSKADIEDEKRE